MTYQPTVRILRGKEQHKEEMEIPERESYLEDRGKRMVKKFITIQTREIKTDVRTHRKGKRRQNPSQGFFVCYFTSKRTPFK